MICKIDTKKKYESVDAIKDFLEEISSHKEVITTLDLSMNTYVPAVAVVLADIIKDMKNLKKIILESIMDSLNVEEMKEVVSTLLNALPSTLEEFEMPSNALSCEYPDALSNFVSSFSLRVLNLYNCGLGEDGLIRLTKDIAKLKNKSILNVLNLGKNRINRFDESFVKLFNEFENLIDFRIKANTIEENGLCYFLENAVCKNLRIFDLSDNFVCGNCHSALGELFKRTKLEELYLYDAKMDEGGLYEFLRLALEKPMEVFPGGMNNSKPELTLDISCLGFGQDCIPCLEQLANMYRFKRLIIYENDYEDIIDLTELVKSNGGIIVTEEEQAEECLLVDKDIVERLKNIL